MRLQETLGLLFLWTLHSAVVYGWPAPEVLPGSKKLQISTIKATAAPARIPRSYSLNLAQRSQSPSDIHVLKPKRHPYNKDQNRLARSNPVAKRVVQAAGYQKRASELQGVTPVLDSTQPSQLKGQEKLVFESQANTYKPNTNLFDATALKKPLPTNRWWLNLMLEKGADPIHPYPYLVRCATNGSSIGLPKFSSTAQAITSDQVIDWQIGDDDKQLTKRLVTGADALGVQVTWSGTGAAQMKSRFYKGMAFQTFVMTQMTPLLRTGHAITSMQPLENAAADMPALTRVKLNSGAEWLIASKPAIQWKKTSGQLVGQAKYTGYVQLAHLGDKPDSNIQVLQQYAGTYATEGSVTYSKIEGSGDARSANIVLLYKTNADAGGDTSYTYNTPGAPSTKQLLSFVLPHHVDRLDSKSLLSPGLTGFRSTKGPLKAIGSNSISYKQKIETVDFTGSNVIADADKTRIQSQLTKDMAKVEVTASDPYFFGKGVARVARLLQIAQEIGDTASASKLQTQVIALLQPWLVKKSNSDPLVYDETWGGIVSTVGLKDSSADYGQGRYNDHHFHYGYFLYAAAVLAKHDINSFAPLKEGASQLLRDYANPSMTDEQFPYMRHFDPYDGHSWAAGLFTFGDGRNQESTGEAINAYYAAYLYAKALGLKETADFYEIVLNMEAASARRYWHPTRAQATELYGEAFKHNAVGILWSSKADYATFFGADPEFIYGIQMIPFTPATKMIITQDWVKDAWCSDQGACPDGMKTAAAHANKNGWAQFLYTAYSVVDRNSALENAMACKPDDGNSLTNTLHWILTSGQAASPPV
ncbi:glycoside hydrolase [Coemansia reversa NRRL 1564]|uniref:glucan endo-1,3-beta-D-glucosidase n=1 Tax=Coemansia reversa (strain ATCC 12441 / NRRL 1564) TaxID=763665 RepID=A0A2G5B4W9_COERN|nr:glycoside hydrolase [Coemansia reversa NRRL 1564]|eukprot:PIA14068.1 glycoside hydrolase [Coemansia reversa NRRL 1564]